MGSHYAKGTKVPALKTEMEIRTFLESRGADDVGSMKADGGRLAVVTFKRNGLLIRMEMPLTVAGEQQRQPATRTGRAWVDMTVSEAKAQQEARERWRNLLLIIKALFAAVDSGIRTFEEAFLSDVVVPDGKGGSTTVGRLTIHALRESHRTGKAPKLLTAATEVGHG